MTPHNQQLIKYSIQRLGIKMETELTDIINTLERIEQRINDIFQIEEGEN